MTVSSDAKSLDSNLQLSQALSVSKNHDHLSKYILMGQYQSML